jgi:hypothetical protein
MDWNPEQVHLVERNPHRTDRSFEDGRVSDVEFEFHGKHQTAGFFRFGTTPVDEIDVRPAGESVLLIPDAFAVAEQNKSVHRFLSSGRRRTLREQP